MAFWIRRNGASVAAPHVFTSAQSGGDGASATFNFRSSSTTYQIPMVQSGKVVSGYAYRPKNAFQLHAYKNGVVHAVNGLAPTLKMNYTVTATRASSGYGTSVKYQATFRKIVLAISTPSPGMGAAIPINYTIGNKSGTVTLNAGVTSQSFEITLNYTTSLTTSSNPDMDVRLTIAAGNYYASKALTYTGKVYYAASGQDINFYNSPQLSAMAGKIF